MLVPLLLLNLFGFTFAQDSRCNGVPSTDWSCCNTQTPCEVGGGDCDRDSDCLGSLKCGSNNCRDDFSSDGSNWSSNADCCYGKYVHNIFILPNDFTNAIVSVNIFLIF